MATYQRICEECHKPYEAHQPNGRFCSNKCRQANYRRTHRPHYKSLVFADDGFEESDAPLVNETEIADAVVRLRGCVATFSAGAVNGPPELRPCCSRLQRAMLAALESEGL